MRKVITPTLRFQVLNRDNFTCQYCGLKASEGVQLQIDHKISVKNGGTNNVNNLITSCFQCNIGKGKNNINEIKQKLYETKISDNIGKHIFQFYEWWNYKKLGTIDNNSRALLKIYFSNELGGNNYKQRLDFHSDKYLGKDVKNLNEEDYKKLEVLFKEGGEYCNDVLYYMEGPFGPLISKENFDEYSTGYYNEQILNDKIWNGECKTSYNLRLNYILTELLIESYNNGMLKNNYTIKKFSYFFNKILCHKE